MNEDAQRILDRLYERQLSARTEWREWEAKNKSLEISFRIAEEHPGYFAQLGFAVWPAQPPGDLVWETLQTKWLAFTKGMPEEAIPSVVVYYEEYARHLPFYYEDPLREDLVFAFTPKESLSLQALILLDRVSEEDRRSWGAFYVRMVWPLLRRLLGRVHLENVRNRVAFASVFPAALGVLHGTFFRWIGSRLMEALESGEVSTCLTTPIVDGLGYIYALDVHIGVCVDMLMEQAVEMMP